MIDDAEELLPRVPLHERLALVAGRDAWTVAGPSALGNPVLVLSDGPAGVRGESFVAGRSTAFPCGTALGATFDPELVERVGRALGGEAVERGVHVLLGPTVNLHRHPLGGRNFESFSEDPELTGQLAAAYVRGVQSRGVACCVKHFVGNDTECERHTVSSNISDAVLHELYLAPFEAAVRAGVWSVMASYNRVDGTYASEHEHLLEGLLRKELGFDGVVVSDWFALHSTAVALRAGLDLEMPGPTRFRGDKLLEAIGSGAVDVADLERSARRVLQLILRTRRPVDSGQRDPGEVARLAATRSMVLLRNEGGVLPLDPAAIGSVALIGPNAAVGQFQGGGSVQVNPESVAGIAASLAAALGPAIGLRPARGCVDPDYPSPLAAPELSTPDGRPGAQVEIWERVGGEERLVSSETARSLQLVWLGAISPGRSNDDLVMRARGVWTPSDGGVHQLALVGAGRARLSIGDRAVGPETPPTADVDLQISDDDLFEVWRSATRLDLPVVQGEPVQLLVELSPASGRELTMLALGVVPPANDLLEGAVSRAAECDVAVVVAESPPGWETEGRDRASFSLPSGQDQLIAKVAAANPRTVVVLNVGAPVAMPWADDVAAIVAAWFPGQAIGTALADILVGRANPSGRLPTTFPHQLDDVPADAYYPAKAGVMDYGEGLMVGYRTPAWPPVPAPRYPFGFGLSYSRFELGTPALSPGSPAPAPSPGEHAGEPCVEVRVPVTNAAGPDGREVVQVYLESGRPGRPAIELKGFASVEVPAGATVDAVVRVPLRSLRHFGPAGWEPLHGDVAFRVGTSALDLPHRLQIQVPPAAPT